MILTIAAGMARQGPAAKQVQDIAMLAKAIAVAPLCSNMPDGFVIQESDLFQVEAIGALGIKTLVVTTILDSLLDRVDLAQ